MTDNPPAGIHPDTGDGALDLDAMRKWIAKAQEPVAQGSGAVWALVNHRDLAVATAERLLAEVTTLRQSLTEAEASHQAEMGRLIIERDEARAGWNDAALTLTARIVDLEHTITQYLDSHGTAGTGVLGKRLKAAVGRVE